MVSRRAASHRDLAAICADGHRHAGHGDRRPRWRQGAQGRVGHAALLLLHGHQVGAHAVDGRKTAGGVHGLRVALLDLHGEEELAAGGMVADLRVARL